MKISKKKIVKPKNIVARERANFEPTDELEKYLLFYKNI
jgi:hypothetical protein